MFISLYVLSYGAPAIAVIVAGIKLWLLLRQRWRYLDLISSFPGPKGHWWYGNVKEFSGDYKGLLRSVNYANQYGGIFPIWSGPFDVTLFAVHPSTAKTILAGMDPKDASYSLLKPWLGEGLLLQSGPRWERNRQLFTPAFHVDFLKTYITIFSQTVDELVSKWRTLGAAGTVEVFHHASLLTMDSMLRCLFGHVSNCQQETYRHKYIQGVHEVSSLIVSRLVKPHLTVDFIYKLTEEGKQFQAACHKIHTFSRQIILDRRDLVKTEKPGCRPMDFLDVLINAQDSDGQGLSDQEIQDEVDTFMFAGHDSTASSLAWCLYNLAAHAHWQEACRSEARKVLGDGQAFSWDSLKKLEVITACIQESMRLYPAVPNLSRFTDREIVLPDGRVIPKGIRVAVSLFSLHRNPEFWNDPEIYDPNRFLDCDMDDLSRIHMPFSVGPRNCIGKNFAQTQLKVAVATILLNFRLSAVPERPPIPESSLILRSRDGLYLKLNSLKDKA